MIEEHKEIIAKIFMNDYDIRPSLAHLIVKVFIESAEQIIKEDAEIIGNMDFWEEKEK
ncbi:MAG: hypothetical protein IKN54_04390 [Lachnospiraceae bacterium]|nr:hypothetical protein [Lachnospiraceae bacterium]